MKHNSTGLVCSFCLCVTVPFLFRSLCSEWEKVARTSTWPFWPPYSKARMQAPQTSSAWCFSGTGLTLHAVISAYMARNGRSVKLLPSVSQTSVKRTRITGRNPPSSEYLANNALWTFVTNWVWYHSAWHPFFKHAMPSSLAPKLCSLVTKRLWRSRILWRIQPLPLLHIPNLCCQEGFASSVLCLCCVWCRQVLGDIQRAVYVLALSTRLPLWQSVSVLAWHVRGPGFSSACCHCHPPLDPYPLLSTVATYKYLQSPAIYTQKMKRNNKQNIVGKSQLIRTVHVLAGDTALVSSVMVH